MPLAESAKTRGLETQPRHVLEHELLVLRELFVVQLKFTDGFTLAFSWCCSLQVGAGKGITPSPRRQRTNAPRNHAAAPEDDEHPRLAGLELRRG